ncbi:MAG TPA: tripartite tricarboxylate transporter substrate-binding protein [Burkholderiales bacterium]|nr:tripartite tricarboxylate transporter substrate-binding protein [Burkholderiales bacterium]
MFDSGLARETGHFSNWCLCRSVVGRSPRAGSENQCHIPGQTHSAHRTLPAGRRHRGHGACRVTGTHRNFWATLPTLAETFAGFQVSSWYGCWGPKNLPRDIVMRWNSAIVKILATPIMRERMAAEGLDAIGGSPERLLERLREEVPRLIKVVKAANIQAIQ